MTPASSRRRGTAWRVGEPILELELNIILKIPNRSQVSVYEIIRNSEYSFSFWISELLFLLHHVSFGPVSSLFLSLSYRLTAALYGVPLLYFFSHRRYSIDVSTAIVQMSALFFNSNSSDLYSQDKPYCFHRVESPSFPPYVRRNFHPDSFFPGTSSLWTLPRTIHGYFA